MKSFAAGLIFSVPSRSAFLLFCVSGISFAQDQQEAKRLNHLAKETSPYLLQHKHNPVDWYPWGKEALARAKAEDKVIFLSIGYSACHWCHVMEHESFESEKIAKSMNEKFVNIKVDREERPDLDEIYMAATVRFNNGHGGWPMSVFLTPNLKPFFCGTYFPPEDRHGMPGFPRVIEHIDQLWKMRRDDVLKASIDLAEQVRIHLQPEAVPGDLEPKHVDQVAASSAQRFDSDHGGFGWPPRFAPKFPHASELSLLMRHHARSGDEKTLRIVTTTLEKMAAGGIWDLLGGGFHRYSTDRLWLVPHFEKMLYDNSLLARTYAEASMVTGNESYLATLREILDYMLREMQDASGGFYSTQDADSEGEEGKFFVWQAGEIIEALGEEDARLVALRWGVTEAGNWEGKNILSAVATVEEVARETGKKPTEIARRLEAIRAVLLERRGRRVHPRTDDKVLAAWNGLAIAACAIGYQRLGDERYLSAGRRAAGFVLSEMRREGRLLRTWRHGEAKLMAYLEDYAFVADGLLCLFETDFDPRWLVEARALLAGIEKHFLDADDGNFFFTAGDHEELVTRSKSVSESSMPSGIALATSSFLRAGLLLGDEELYQIGVNALRANHAIIESQGISCPSLLLAVEFHLGDPREVVIAGDPGDETTRAMLSKLRQEFPVHHVIAVVHDGNREDLERISPVFKGKIRVDGKPTAYVCRRGVCEAPVTDPGQITLK